MPTNNTVKIKTKQPNLFLRVASGHFATNHSHSNYYIDVVAQKSRLSEAKAVAKALCSSYSYTTTIVDTVLCLDGTEVIGACLANELTKNAFMKRSPDNLCCHTRNDRQLTNAFPRQYCTPDSGQACACACSFRSYRRHSQSSY